MKKLKLQKALLAIFLALPITLTINNEINAMRSPQKQNGSQIKQKPIQLADTYYQSMPQYIKFKGKKTTLELEDDDYDDYLHLYIGEDINRYLALFLQLRLITDQIPKVGEITQEQNQTLKLYNRFSEYTLNGDDPSQQTTTNATTNIDNKKQLKKIIDSIKQLYHSEGYDVSKTQRILQKLLTYQDYSSTGFLFSEVNRLISSLTPEEMTTEYSKYSDLIKSLEPAEQQLLKEISTQNQNGDNTPLARLAQTINKFIDAYKPIIAEHEEAEREMQEEAEKERLKKEKEEEEEQAVDTDINQIEQLIKKWQQQKGKINKEKEAKLKKLEQDIKSLERKYKRTKIQKNS